MFLFLLAQVFGHLVVHYFGSHLFVSQSRLPVLNSVFVFYLNAKAEHLPCFRKNKKHTAGNGT
jgi:hypothetical protein